MRLILIPYVILFSIACCSAAELEPTATLKRIPGSKPLNIVLILTDDHRYDALGFMGHPFLKTPHMVTLAKNGAHLQNAFVTTSLCSPSRVSILSGLYAHRHRVVDKNVPVPAGLIFFPQYLRQ